MSEVFDPGLQPERTLLAWRRTALAIATMGGATIKFGAEVSLAPALLLGAVCLALAGTAAVLASRRYRRDHDALSQHARLSSGATPHLALTASVLALVCLGLLMLVA